MASLAVAIGSSGVWGFDPTWRESFVASIFCLAAVTFSGGPLCGKPKKPLDRPERPTMPTPTQMPDEVPLAVIFSFASVAVAASFDV